MKNVKIIWNRTDNYGSVQACYRSRDGRLRLPSYRGCVWADRFAPLTVAGALHPFNFERLASVYWLPGVGYAVVESVSSKVFKPLEQWLKDNAARHPHFIPKGWTPDPRAALGHRQDILNYAVRCL